MKPTVGAAAVGLAGDWSQGTGAGGRGACALARVSFVAIGVVIGVATPIGSGVVSAPDLDSMLKPGPEPAPTT